MNEQEKLGPATSVVSIKVGRKTTVEEMVPVATEIPLTIIANGVELATFLCSPSHLQEMTMGFLFNSGFIAKASEVKSLQLDCTNWKSEVTMENTPNAEIIAKRIYTSGCGKGVTYANISEIPASLPLENDVVLAKSKIFAIMQWFQVCSDLHRETHGVHTAAVSCAGAIPTLHFDDIGRHNAIDKIVGHMLMEKLPFAGNLLLTSGRVSSEIVHKAAHCGFPVIVSLSAATHQALLMAQVMNITLLCFAKGGKFAILANPARISLF